MKPGDVVGARCWPAFGNHPDCWQKPRQGVVLDIEDPRAWSETLAFPEKAPQAEAVRRHVAWCRANIPGAFQSVPVLWDYGHSMSACWCRTDSLRPYADDYLDWLTTRDREYNRVTSFRRESQADREVFHRRQSASPAGARMREHLGIPE